MTDTMSREEIVALLKTGPCTVTFIKVDGTERRGMFTLHPDHLPPLPVVESKDGEAKPKREPNLKIVSAWDMEKSAWRSFVVENLKEIIAHV
jgi:hypothetical protein